jgi:hypothetical protein
VHTIPLTQQQSAFDKVEIPSMGEALDFVILINFSSVKILSSSV